DVERRQRVDAARIGDREVPGELRPGADPDPVGLRDRTAQIPVQRAVERLCRWLALGPDALFERARQLGNVRLPDEIVALMIERGIEEEAVVLHSKAFIALS